MSRKRFIDLENVKFSLNISGRNKEFLDDLTERKNLKYGPCINYLISKFCDMPEEFKIDLKKMINNKIDNINTALEGTKEKLHVINLKEDKEYYMDLLDIIAPETEEIKEELEEEETINLVDYELKNGVLRIPDSWIIVNPEEASACSYASVLVDRNYAKYNTPYFVFLNNYKYGKDYPKEFEQTFHAKCLEKCPGFSKIVELEKQNKLKEDPERPGEYLNLEEYLSAPILGLFPILEEDDKYNADPPYGAVIIRN